MILRSLPLNYGHFCYYAEELEEVAVRNPKPEIRDPKEARNPNAETGASRPPIRISPIGFPSVPSDFGFRNSEFGLIIPSKEGPSHDY